MLTAIGTSPVPSVDSLRAGAVHAMHCQAKAAQQSTHIVCEAKPPQKDAGAALYRPTIRRDLLQRQSVRAIQAVIGEACCVCLGHIRAQVVLPVEGQTKFDRLRHRIGEGQHGTLPAPVPRCHTPHECRCPIDDCGIRFGVKHAKAAAHVTEGTRGEGGDHVHDGPATERPTTRSDGTQVPLGCVSHVQRHLHRTGAQLVRRFDAGGSTGDAGPSGSASPCALAVGDTGGYTHSSGAVFKVEATAEAAQVQQQPVVDEVHGHQRASSRWPSKRVYPVQPKPITVIERKRDCRRRERSLSILSV
eukprot:5171741-Prymnesium_polylepis.2